ncbi:hypothetical protein [Gilvibacter sp.]|uniref:hypothetical protein n=1 Tax=Gilvibacter sp. TaxID=2729997 RepID=UPI003F49E625
MAHPEIDRFTELAELIIGLEQDDNERQELQDWLNEYSWELREAATEKAATKEFRRQLDVMAKSLPAIAKGMEGAIKGFQNGDSFAGSAGVIDAVGSVVTMVTGMLGSAAGPPGAVVGSVLSIFSMILKMFSKQKPEKSIEEKLANIIKVHDAEVLRDNLQAVKNEINQNLKDFNGYIKAKEKHPFLQIQADLNISRKDELMSNARVWITKNQDVKYWEDVLVAYCYAHITLIQAISMAMTIVKEESNISYLATKTHTRNQDQLEFLKEVKPLAQNQGTVWIMRSRKFNRHGNQLFKRDAVVSEKKEWQKYQIGYTPLSFAVSNRTLSKQGGEPESTALFTLDNTYGFIRTAHWDRDKQGSLYHPFRKDVPGESPLGIIHARYGLTPLSTRAEVHTMVPHNYTIEHDYYDIWALPGHKPGKIDLYTAEGNKIVYWTQGTKEHTSYMETRLSFNDLHYLPEGYKAGAVRAATISSFEDEKNYLTKNVIHGIYGACEVQANKSVMGTGGGGVYMPPHYESDHMEINVHFRSITWKNGSLTQPPKAFCLAPWPNFVGLAVDSHYLWVFKAGAIACATHTEVYMSLIRGDDSPPWMVYDIPNEVGNSDYDPSEMYEDNGGFYPMGLLDLSACDDGTLVGVYCDKPEVQAPVYNMIPKIDRLARTLKFEGTSYDTNSHTVLTNGWETDGTARVNRVIKQRINCWPLLTGLEKVLESQLKV